MKSKARAVKMLIGDSEYTAIEFPIEVMEQMNFADGEILDVTIEDDKFVVTKTGIIYHGDRET